MPLYSSSSTPSSDWYYPSRVLAKRGWYSSPYYTLHDVEAMPADRRMAYILAFMERLKALTCSKYRGNRFYDTKIPQSTSYSWTLPQILKIICGPDPLAREQIMLKLIKEDRVVAIASERLPRSEFVHLGPLIATQRPRFVLVQLSTREFGHYEEGYSLMWFRQNVGKPTAHSDDLYRARVDVPQPAQDGPPGAKRRKTSKEDISTASDPHDRVHGNAGVREIPSTFSCRRTLLRKDGKLFVKEWECAAITRPFASSNEEDIALLKAYQEESGEIVSALELINSEKSA